LIRDQIQTNKIEGDFDLKNKLSELKTQIEVAESLEFKNIRDRVKHEKNPTKRKFIRKKKMDDNLKRIGQYLPAQLIEKLQGI
jgi:hypothetical protein